MSERAFNGHVVVVTGASSGIGRLAALEFARRGASVVAAARNQRALGTLEAEASGSLGSVVTVAADVSNIEDVRGVAAAATDEFGRIDTWVNNASVMLYARYQDMEPDELRRILDVNLVGTHNGMLAALEVMQRQDCGTIANIGSVESIRAFPLQAGYAASKHGVKALTEALRVELEHTGSPIRVSLIEPAYINTPLFHHARSKIGGQPRPLPPVYQPEAVVDAVLHVARHPVNEMAVGSAAQVLTWFERLNPGIVDQAFEAVGLAGDIQRTDEPPVRRDNLFEPLDEPGATHGPWGELARERSWFSSTIGKHPRASRVIAAAVLLALLAHSVRRR